MKPLFFSILTFLLVIHIQAQNANGKVVDNETTIELSNVVINNSDYTFSTVTNKNGAFLIPKKVFISFLRKATAQKQFLFQVIQLS